MPPGDPPIKVMMVDDDEATLVFFRRQLANEAGIEVAWVAREDQAVALAESRGPNVVVVDGGWRGRGVFEQLRSALPHTRVLTVNGLSAAAQVSRVAPGPRDVVGVRTGPGQRLAAAIRRVYAGDGPTSLTLGLPPTTELVTHFQGVHDLHAGDAVVGFEALMRWGNQGELVPPGSFLPLVEAEGRITDYDHHVVRSALTQLGTWRRQRGVRPLGWVSVNLSGVNLRRPDFSGWVARTLQTCEVDPASLVLEFDQADLSADFTMSARRLSELHSLGVRTAVDNIVSGPSALGRVAGLRPDVLKVGRGLVHEIGRSPEAVETMRALLQATSVRGWPCIATGVEDGAQLDALRSIGWQFAQGHVLSKPTTPFGCEALIADSGSS